MSTEALRLALEALKRFEGEYAWTSACYEAVDAIEAALKAKDEPVTENGMYRLGYHNGYGFGEAYGKANAPQRKPLTDEEIEALAKEHIAVGTRSFEEFARRIEAAHGIKEAS